MDELTRLVIGWSHRARWQRVLRGLLRGLAVGLGLGLLLALAARLRPLLPTGQIAVVAAGLALGGLLVALVLPWLRSIRRSPLAWAREFDQRFGLKERTSTALELGATETGSASPLLALQREDALAAASRVQIRRALPLSIDARDALVAAGLAMALLLALALPNAQNDVLAQRAQFAAAARSQMEALDKAEQALRDSPDLTEAQKQAAIEAVERARERLSDPTITPEQAVAALNEAQSKLDALKEGAHSQRLDDLREAGRNMAPSEATRGLAEALSKGDFDTASEQLRHLLDPNGKPLSEAEQQQVASQLDGMARDVQGSDPQMAGQLREAAQAIREQRQTDAIQRLQQAAGSLDKASQAQSAEQALEGASNATGSAREALTENRGGQPGSSSETPGQSGSPGNSAGQGPPQNSNGPGQGPSGGHSEDSGSDHSVLEPESRLGESGSDVTVPGSNGSAQPDPNGQRNQAGRSPSLVPYEQVYQDYARSADLALQTGQVPAELRDYVRDYFTSLDPGR